MKKLSATLHLEGFARGSILSGYGHFILPESNSPLAKRRTGEVLLHGIILAP